jgi:hypothetical protein
MPLTAASLHEDSTAAAKPRTQMRDMAEVTLGGANQRPLA